MDLRRRFRNYQIGHCFRRRQRQEYKETPNQYGNNYSWCPPPVMPRQIYETASGLPEQSTYTMQYGQMPPQPGECNASVGDLSNWVYA